jgi:hypothetical protein
VAYAGETVRVISRIKDYDENPITGDDGVAVTLNVYDAELAQFAGPFTMAWDAEEEYWFHDWDTQASGAEKGSYRTKVRAEGDIYKAWSVGRLRLAASPV